MWDDRPLGERRKMELVKIGVVCAVFGGSILGIFRMKTRGFGRHTSSLILLFLMLFAAALLAVLGQIDPQPLLNILFAIAGYAGGLITNQASVSTQESN